MSAEDYSRASLDEASIDVLFAAASGDPGARQRVLSRMRPEVARSFGERLDHEGALRSTVDVAHDVGLALTVALPRQGDEYAALWSFVLTVAVHQGAMDEEDGATAHGERATRMNELLERLPEDQRSILLLRVRRERSTPDAALILGSSPAAVRVAQHRALMTLRRALREPPPD